MSKMEDILELLEMIMLDREYEMAQLRFIRERSRWADGTALKPRLEGAR